MLNKLKQRENGDTIVEVLICMAILTIILAGAYYTANQSYRNDRDSLEHSEALTIAQTQVEDLRTAGTITSGNQCFTSSGGGTANCDIPNNNTSQNLTSASCQSGGASYCYVADVSQSATITLNDPTVILSTYTVQVKWQVPGGSSDYVTLYYRQDPAT